MDIVNLWGVKVSTYNNDALVCIHRYESVVSSHQRFAIGATIMRVLMQEKTTTV